MTEVLFYHLEQKPLEQVLPVLLEKTLERGWHAVVEATSQERLQSLDTSLWTWRDDSFLPHAVIGGENDDQQPIILTSGGENPNGAVIRFFVDRAVPRPGEGYQRLVFLFDGHDPDAVADARNAWKALRDGNDCTYWQQEPDGRWVKKA